MKNKTYFGWFAFGFLAVVAVVFGGFALLQGRQNIAVDSRPAPRTPVPDSILVTPATDSGDDEIVENATAGYYFSMPSNWYVEKSAGAGVTIYPDYDPSDASSSPAECKIEIAAFSVDQNTDLNGWLASELHADPTADVTESSQTNLTIGSSSAIEWQGTMNGVSTTLVYALANGTVFEIAPSTLSNSDDASADDNGDCDLELQALVANLHFGNYEQ